MLNILLIATVLTFFYQLSLRLKGRAETTGIPLISPHFRFFCRSRTLCDSQSAALSCSELVLILPQMAVVINGAWPNKMCVSCYVTGCLKKPLTFHTAVGSTSSWTRTAYQLDY